MTFIKFCRHHRIMIRLLHNGGYLKSHLNSYKDFVILRQPSAVYKRASKNVDGYIEFSFEDNINYKMTIDFYYSPGSGPCRFVELTAKTLGLTLNHKLMDLMVKKDHLTPEFIKINPQHCIPTIVDNGFSVWESSVIATYLVQTYAKDDSLYPKDPKKRSVVDQRLYFNLGVLGQRFADYYYPLMMSNATPDQEKFKKLQDGVEILNTFLEGKQYVAGDTLTLADLAISSTIATFDAAKFDRTSYKNVTKWYAKIQSTVPGFEEINGLEKLNAIFEAYRKSRQ